MTRPRIVLMGSRAGGDRRGPGRRQRALVGLLAGASIVGALTLALALERRLAEAIDDHVIATILLLIAGIITIAFVSPLFAKPSR